MIELMSPKGLGNTLYLRAVTLHFLERGDQVRVFSKWPDVFADLPVEVRSLSEGYTKPGVRKVLYGSWHEPDVGESEFDGCCKYAGISDSVELRIKWTAKNLSLLDRIRSAARGKEILVFQSPRVPRNDLQELLTPRFEAFDAYINSRTDCYRVRLGHPPYVFDDRNAQCELDLYGKGFIFDTLDVVSIADVSFSQPSFLNIAAEAMDKKFVCMFARAALNSSDWLHRVNPSLIFHKKHLGVALYDD